MAGTATFFIVTAGTATCCTVVAGTATCCTVVAGTATCFTVVAETATCFTVVAGTATILVACTATFCTAAWTWVVAVPVLVDVLVDVVVSVGDTVGDPTGGVGALVGSGHFELLLPLDFDPFDVDDFGIFVPADDPFFPAFPFPLQSDPFLLLFESLVPFDLGPFVPDLDPPLPLVDLEVEGTIVTCWGIVSPTFTTTVFVAGTAFIFVAC